MSIFFPIEQNMKPNYHREKICENNPVNKYPILLLNSQLVISSILHTCKKNSYYHVVRMAKDKQRACTC